MSLNNIWKFFITFKTFLNHLQKHVYNYVYLWKVYMSVYGNVHASRYKVVLKAKTHNLLQQDSTDFKSQYFSKVCDNLNQREIIHKPLYVILVPDITSYYLTEMHDIIVIKRILSRNIWLKTVHNFCLSALNVSRETWKLKTAYK